MPDAQPPAKRRRLPFNPPRPRASPNAGPSTNNKPSNRTATASSSKPRNSTTRRQPSQSPSHSPPASRSPSESNARDESESADEGEPDYILAEIITQNQNNETDILNSEPTVPPKLLTRLLHHHFQNPKTKIAKDANEVVAKYVDVFVREALARAAFERNESGNGGNGIGDGFLEVCFFSLLDQLAGYYIGLFANEFCYRWRI